MSDKKAIIYCRVSNKKQKHDGDGLHSQEHRCRDYAVARGYVIEAVFNDDFFGGGDFMKCSKATPADGFSFKRK